MGPSARIRSLMMCSKVGSGFIDRFCWHNNLISLSMTPMENLYYAVGELSYVVARADGIVQPEEKEKFGRLVSAALAQGGSGGVDVSQIIFQLLERKKHYDGETTYNWAMDTIRNSSHYLSPALKEKFTSILQKVAEAYPPVTAEEREILVRFKNDIMPLKGDPAFYSAP